MTFKHAENAENAGRCLVKHNYLTDANNLLKFSYFLATSQIVKNY